MLPPRPHALPPAGSRPPLDRHRPPAPFGRPVLAGAVTGVATAVLFGAIEVADGLHGVRASSGANEPGRAGDGTVFAVLLLVFLGVALVGIGSTVGGLVRWAAPTVAPLRLSPLVAELAAIVGTVGAVSALVAVGGTSYGHWSPGYVVPRAAMAGAVVVGLWLGGSVVRVRRAR